MDYTPHTRRPNAWLACALLLALALAGCDGGGGGGGPDGPSGTVSLPPGTLVLFAEDQAADNVLAFELTLSSVTITNSAGTVTPLLASAVPLEWRSRGLAPTVVSVTSLPPGTYTQISLTVSSPEMTVFDFVTGTALVTPPLSVSTVNLDTSLVLGSDEVLGVRLDFDLRSSVQLDTNNDFIIDPTFAVVPTSFVVGELPGDIDDVLASISGVDAANNQLTASILGTGLSLTTNVDGSTIFEGVSGLTELLVGDTIELDARLQANGNFLALEIEREAPGAVRQLRGLVLRTGVLVLESVSAGVDPGTVVGIGVIFPCAIPPCDPPPTNFRISTEDLPVATFPNFDFDGVTIAEGQFVHVVLRDGVTGFIADTIVLEEVTVVAPVGAAVGTTSFSISPQGDFFLTSGLADITVATSFVTELENMSAGLGSLQPNLSIVAVRGVLVFQGGNGVLVAKRVRLLQ